MSMAGRPRREFNQAEFERLLAIQCTQSEICSVFGTTEKTLSVWCKRTYNLDFSQCYKKFGDKGKISLRRAQFKLAQKNATMAIWLGKQYLGQRDHQTVEVKGDNDEKYTEDIQRRIAEMRCVANADVLSCDSRSENRTDETDGNS